MSRVLPLLLAVFAGLELGNAAWAADPADKEVSGAKPAEKEPAKDQPERAQKPVEKTGSVQLAGVGVPYLVQTGTMPLFKEDGSPRADVFYVYYAATGADGKRLSDQSGARRPVTFCFNGGPGASAVWLHLGGLGPQRLDLPPDGLTAQTVNRTVENPRSILDRTDLVFVDPVSTGLSRAVKGEKADQFFGVEEDIQAAGEFVRLFTTRERRWASPKYFCGESYGVTRVAGLTDYLQDKHGLYADGIILISGLVNFQTISADNGNDLPYVLFLPAMTAAAHYHGKLEPALQAAREKTLDQARAFAFGEYAAALLQGAELGEGQRRAIAAQVARYTGLSAAQVLDQDLRIDPGFFRKALLAAEGKVIGRFDARVTGAEDDRSELRAGFDPSLSYILGGFSSAVNAYVRGALGYESDQPYRLLTGLPWRWSSYEGRYVATGENLARALKSNPQMRVLVLSGDCDLAVPADSMRYSLSHLPVPAALRRQIRFSRYQSGHMMYLFQPDAEKLRADLLEFIRP